MTLHPDNPMRSAAAATLAFEVIVIWLAFIGMLQVSGLSLAQSLPWCAVVTLLCLVGTAGLRMRWGYVVGWVAQAGLLALGLLTPWMVAMGIIFAVIWAACVLLGRRIEARKETQ